MEEIPFALENYIWMLLYHFLLVIVSVFILSWGMVEPVKHQPSVAY